MAVTGQGGEIFCLSAVTSQSSETNDDQTDPLQFQEQAISLMSHKESARHPKPLLSAFKRNTPYLI